MWYFLWYSWGQTPRVWYSEKIGEIFDNLDLWTTLTSTFRKYDPSVTLLGSNYTYARNLVKIGVIWRIWPLTPTTLTLTLVQSDPVILLWGQTTHAWNLEKIGAIFDIWPLTSTTFTLTLTKYDTSVTLLGSNYICARNLVKIGAFLRIWPLTPNDLDLCQIQPLSGNSGVNPHTPTKFRQERPKDLGGVGEQTDRQTNKRSSNFSMIPIFSLWNAIIILTEYICGHFSWERRQYFFDWVLCNLTPSPLNKTKTERMVHFHFILPRNWKSFWLNFN